jgi:hypothetical protein
MKYLKLFEDLDPLYKEINYDGYSDYYTSHTPDHSMNNIIITILKEYFGDFKNFSSMNNIIIDILPYNIITPDGFSKVSSLRLTNMEDEYILVSMHLKSSDDKYFLCDGRDGLISLLNKYINI